MDNISKSLVEKYVEIYNDKETKRYLICSAVKECENTKEKTLETFNAQDMIDLLFDFVQVKKVNTLSMYVMYFRKFFAWCMAGGFITENVMDDYLLSMKNLKLILAENVEFKYLDRTYIEKLCSPDNLNPKYAEALIRSIYEGLVKTAREFAMLKESEFDFENRVYHFPTYDWKISDKLAIALNTIRNYTEWSRESGKPLKMHKLFPDSLVPITCYKPENGLTRSIVMALHNIVNKNADGIDVRSCTLYQSGVINYFLSKMTQEEFVDLMIGTGLGMGKRIAKIDEITNEYHYNMKASGVRELFHSYAIQLKERMEK